MARKGGITNFANRPKIIKLISPAPNPLCLKNRSIGLFLALFLSIFSAKILALS